MTVQPELVSPQERFLQDDPTILREPDPFAEESLADHPELKRISIAIAAAVVLTALIVRKKLEQEKPEGNPGKIKQKVWKAIAPLWMQATVPAVVQAYQLGATSKLSYNELEALASSYAEELGEYVHETSSNALIEGYNAQVNAGWSEKVAWERATAAYGLDSQQMKSYVTNIIKHSDEYQTDIVTSSSRALIDKAFVMRADRIGSNESFKATQVGRNVVWMAMEAGGELPEGTKKRWDTAQDELVCPVCAPLNGVIIPLSARFQAGDSRVYAPGVHPNCRCEISLIYPLEDVVKAMPGDPYDRDKNGRFAEKEERKSATEAFNMKRQTRASEAFKGKQRESAASAFKPKESAASAMRVNAAEAFRVSAAEAFKQSENKNIRVRVVRNELGQEQVIEEAAPNNPVPQKSTSWFFADNFIRLSDLNREDVLNTGTVINFDARSNKLNGVQQIVTYVDTNNMGDNVNGNDAFAFAADAYTDQEVLNNETSYAIDFGDDFSNEEMQLQKKALLGLGRNELIRMIRNLYENDLTAGTFVSLEDFEQTTDADDVADKMLFAYQMESDDAYERGKSGDTPLSTAWMEMFSVLADKREADYKNPRELMEEGREGGTAYTPTTPIVFMFKNWYGEERNQGQKETPNIGLVEGKYVVSSVTKQRPNLFKTTNYNIDDVAVVELRPLGPGEVSKIATNLVAFKSEVTRAGR